MVDCVAELTWIQQLLGEIGVPLSSPYTVYCDNISTTYLALNSVFHARTKHIELDVHFVCEQVGSGRLQIRYIPTQDQLADVLTKGLSSTHHRLLRVNLLIIQALSD